MVYDIFLYGFAAITLLSVVGAWLKRTKRVALGWAAVCAGTAAVAAGYHIFWPVAVFGLMVFWALFTALPVMNNGWRIKVGLTIYLAIEAALAIFPTYNDELGPGPVDYRSMPPDEAEAKQREASAGNAGFRQWLLANIPFRMVRGLDLKGGLRLVYSVEVEEAIRDKRDHYYGDLRAALTKAYGLHQGDGQPTVEEMRKLSDKVTMHKPRGNADTIVVEFKDPADSVKHIDNKFLSPFLHELSVLRSSEGEKVTFKLKSEVGTEIRNRAVSQAKQTINRRIDGLGVKEASISDRDEDVIIEIPGGDEDEFRKTRDIISQTARLEFKMLHDEVDFFEKYASASDTKLEPGMSFDLENAPIGENKSKPSTYVRLKALQGERLEDAFARFKNWTSTLQIDEDHEIGFGRTFSMNEETDEFEQDGWRTYYLWNKAELTGDMVRDAQARPDQSNSGLGGWNVALEFDSVGGEIFEEITGQNIKKRFAIILDGKVESAPVIQSKIAGGHAQITMGAGSVQRQLEDARKLELVLRSGALPAPISPSNEQRIGATLGEDSIKKGIKAAFLGGLLVLIMMVVSYRKAGMIANIAVMFNLVLQMAVLSMFSASMTLPGIAGLALTIGVAVDANVLINERIKEELLEGKTARAAVAIGYEKAFSAIIDGHATTLISGLILAQYGSGPIKGFAVTLIIGMLTSLFTGVVVTRLLFELWVRGRKRTELSIGL